MNSWFCKESFACSYTIHDTSSTFKLLHFILCMPFLNGTLVISKYRKDSFVFLSVCLLWFLFKESDRLCKVVELSMQFSTTLNTQFNYLTEPVTPLKGNLWLHAAETEKKNYWNPDVKKILYHLKTCLCNMYVQRSIFMDIWQNGYIIVKVWCNFIVGVSYSTLDIGPWTWKFIFAFRNICRSLKGVFAENWKGLYGKK